MAPYQGTAVMKLRELSIKGAYELESPVHGDDRGYFR